MRTDLRLLFEQNPSKSPNAPVKIKCLWHAEDTASLAIYPDHAYCYGQCDKRWHGWIDTLRELSQFVSDGEARLIDYLEKPEDHPPFAIMVEYGSREGSGGGGDALPLTSEDIWSMVDAYREGLKASQPAQDYLYGRGIGVGAQLALQLGYTGRAYAIPVWSEGKVVTIKFRRDDTISESGPKYWGIRGHNGIALYAPETSTDRQTVVLTEGEFDTMIALQCGYRAVSFTGGISTDPEPFLGQFTGVQNLIIAADRDEAGYAGALRWARKFRTTIPEVRIAKWSPWDGKDLTEVYLKKGKEGVCLALETTTWVSE